MAVPGHQTASPSQAGFTGPILRKARAFYELTKPTIVLLILVTAYATLWIASDSPPSLWLSFTTVLGAALAAGSANAINCYYDRDIDQVMSRTRKRPVPAGQVTPREALVFGIVTGVLSVVLLSWLVHPLAAFWALAGNLFYVFVYTMWLKRSTPQNIVIGGAAGSVPPLIAWAAVHGTVAWPAVILFLIIFLWTPPHFWALALFRHEDYARAGVPMLPVVKGSHATKVQILVYTVLLAVVSLLLVPAGAAGWLYDVLAAAFGGYFIYLAWLTLKDPGDRAAKRLFGDSIIYLALVFAAAVIDRHLWIL